MKPLRVIALLAALVICVSTLASCAREEAPGAAATGDDREAVLEAGARVIEAIKARDGYRLAQLVHPERGVRFSPYAYVDIENDRVLSRSEITRLWEDSESYAWGTAEGTGDPISLTGAQYLQRFVLDRDFAGAPVTVNEDRTRGSTNNNAAAVYPQAMRIEYFLEPPAGQGDPAFDWRALRLVFERQGDSWMLIAVIHDEWTP